MSDIRELLMQPASFRRIPRFAVRLCRSLPAKSTIDSLLYSERDWTDDVVDTDKADDRLKLEVVIERDKGSGNACATTFQMLTLNTQWERLESLFNPVSATFRLRQASWMT
jgi:hypothetical protein